MKNVIILITALLLSVVIATDMGYTAEEEAVPIKSPGKIGTIEVIGSLKLLYANENDVGNRISIITALERNPNKVESIKALKELQDVQATPLVSSILKKRLSKLE